MKLVPTRAWRISDDTQLTLATCEAISDHSKVEPGAIASAFSHWFGRNRIVGAGASTYKALVELNQGGHWALVGRRGEMAAGNGAAMRIAPLAFCLDPKDPAARKLIRDVSRITHHSEEAYAGALAVTLAIRAALDGTWDGEGSLIGLVVQHLPDTSVRDRLIEIGSLNEKMPVIDVARRLGSSSYVVDSVPLVLFAVGQINKVGFVNLLEGIITAGGDTDTNASIAGQIAGTLLGQTGLPIEMIERIPDLTLITDIAKAFSETVANRPF